MNGLSVESSFFTARLTGPQSFKLFPVFAWFPAAENRTSARAPAGARSRRWFLPISPRHETPCRAAMPDGEFRAR